jgi:hypothetical protein
MNEARINNAAHDVSRMLLATFTAEAAAFERKYGITGDDALAALSAGMLKTVATALAAAVNANEAAAYELLDALTATAAAWLNEQGVSKGPTTPNE